MRNQIGISNFDRKIPRSIPVLQNLLSCALAHTRLRLCVALGPGLGPRVVAARGWRVVTGPQAYLPGRRPGIGRGPGVGGSPAVLIIRAAFSSARGWRRAPRPLPPPPPPRFRQRLRLRLRRPGGWRPRDMWFRLRKENLPEPRMRQHLTGQMASGLTGQMASGTSMYAQIN